MGITYNLIDISERKFLEQAAFASISTLWTSDGTLSESAVVFQDADVGSLKLTPGALENFVKFNHWANPSVDSPSQLTITSLVHSNDHLEAFVWLKPTVNCVSYLSMRATKVNYSGATQLYSLSTNGNDVIQGEEGSLEFNLGSADSSGFQLLRAIPLALPSTGNYSVSLKIRTVFSTLTNANIHISRPTIHASKTFFRSAFLQDAGMHMPSTFTEQDTAVWGTNQPTFPMTRFMETITTSANDIYKDYTNFTYNDISNQFDPTEIETFSTLVNATYAESRFLPWLSQFRGRELLVTYQPSTSGIPWVTFVLDDSLLDGTSVLGGEASGASLFGGIDAYVRWQVETGYYGHNAGTITAMISAIKRGLTGAGVVTFTYPSANAVHFVTSQAETYGSSVGDVGTSFNNILLLVEPARPLGMIVTHQLSA
jgi:hypothetical protein